jgi:DNA-binding beta-propeller fold protein YncE
VSVTGDNGLALVACQGGGVLSVVTLAAYAEQTQPVDTGGLPTDVTAAADGSLVFAWHNAQRHVFGPSQPALGLFVYTTASGAVSQVLNDQKVVGFVCAPDPALHTGYAVMLGQNVLTIVDTRSFDTKSVPLADPGATRYPDALAISGDGSRLFVVTDDGALHYSMSIFDVSRATPSKLTEIALFTASGLGFLGICAAPDGSQAFVSDSITGNLYVVQQSGRGYAAKPQPIPITGSPMALAILPDGSKVYVLSSTTADRMIAVVDTQSLSVRTMSYGQAFASVSLVGITASPDGQRLFATDMASMAIRVIDPVSLRFIQQIGWSSSVLAPYGIAILPDGSRIFTANVMSNNIAIVQQVQPA